MFFSELFSAKKENPQTADLIALTSNELPELLTAESEKLSVLLIEDTLSDALLLQKSLARSTPEAFYIKHVVRLSDGIAELNQRKYDAVVLDLSLPDSQGLNSIETLRMHFPFIPIVVLTGLNDREIGLAAVQAGAQDYLVKNFSFSGEKIGTALQFAIRRQRLLLEIQIENSKNQYSADHDPLTDLPNRNLFRDRLCKSIALAKREKKQIAVAFVDLDGFKEVNDAFGHLIGDQLLSAAADRFQAAIRDSDTVARVGGDEFLFMLYDCKGSRDLSIIAKKLLGSFDEPFKVDGNKFKLSASIGISRFPDDAETMEDLISAADSAMYRAKELGKNRYRFHSPLLNVQQKSASAQAQTLARGLEQSEFEIHYQPCVDLKTGKTMAVQALPRWQNQQFGLMEAQDFISVAEESGLIVSLNEWILKTACAQLKNWHRQGESSLRLTLNLSKAQMSSKSSLKTILRILTEEQIDPGFLIIEVTELDIHDAYQRNVAFLNELSAAGVKIALDSLGTGFSSLANLKAFPLNYAKIDRSLIGYVHTQSEMKGISKALVDILKSLGIVTIAEGVENQQQIETLLQMDCDWGQGYFFCRPLPAEKLEFSVVESQLKKVGDL